MNKLSLCTRLQVAVLVRPMLDFEGGSDIVQLSGPGTVVMPPKPEHQGGPAQGEPYRFELDAAFR